MLTLNDCVELSDLDIDEVLAIAHHEHLPEIVALEKAHAFLKEQWGAPAVRQMVMDEVRRCAHGGDCSEAAEALALLAKTFKAHPGGVDRREKRPSH